MKKAAKEVGGRHTKSKSIAKVPTFSRVYLLVFALIFACIGGYALYRSFAANPPTGSAYPNLLTETSTANVWLSPTGSDSGSNCTYTATPIAAPAPGTACLSYDKADALAQGHTNAVVGVIPGMFPIGTTPNNPGSDYGISPNGSTPVTFECETGAAADSVTFADQTFLLYGVQNVTFTGSCFHFHVPGIGLRGYPAAFVCGVGGNDPSTGPVTFNGVHMDSFDDTGTCDITIENSQIGPIDACFGIGQAASNGAPASAECSSSNPTEAYWATQTDGTGDVQVEPFVHSNEALDATNTNLTNDTFTGMQTKWPDTMHQGGLLIWGETGLTIEDSTFENNTIYNLEWGTGDNNNTTVENNYFGASYYTLADEVPPLPLPPQQCQDGVEWPGGDFVNDVVSGNTWVQCMDVGDPAGSSYSNTVVTNNTIGPYPNCPTTSGVTYSGNMSSGEPVCGDGSGGGGTPAPTVSLSANPTSISSGSSSTLSWSSSNATSCSASGAWSGSQATSGSSSTGNLSSTSTYNLSCTGAGGSTNASATVTVTSSGGGGGNTITIGDTNVESTADSGNANLLLAQSATLSQAATIESLSFYVTTASGNLRLGIYDASGPGGGPGKLLASTAEIVTATGWDTASVTSPVLLQPGTYWLAYTPSSNNLAFESATSSGSSLVYQSFSYGALPATFSTSPTTGPAHWSFYATLSTSSGTSSVPGDCNGDGHVGSADLVDLLANWHSSTNLACDFNGDGVIDIGDLSILLSHYGS